MPRYLLHLLLALGVVIVPSMRLLCYGTCVPASQSIPHTDLRPSDTPREAPDCHEQETRRSEHAPEDDCTHGGDASWSRLSAAAKSLTGEDLKVGTLTAANPIGLSPVRSQFVLEVPATTATGQQLGLFSTPLRI